MIVELNIILSVLFIVIFRILNVNRSIIFTSWIILETLWTLIPVLILILIGIPSLKLIYNTEALFIKNSINLKISAHQWYWTYSFTDLKFKINAFPTVIYSIYKFGESRDVLILPFNQKISALITSRDVLHAWTLPSAGLKMDAVPGRLNLIFFIRLIPRVLVGQCRELCGAFHSWIPIYLEFSSISLFKQWVRNFWQ